MPNGGASTVLAPPFAFPAAPRRESERQLGHRDAVVLRRRADVVRRELPLLDRRRVELMQLVDRGTRQLFVHQWQLALAGERECAVGQGTPLARVELPVVVDVV